MSLIKKAIYFIFISLIFFANNSYAEEIKKIGKFKDWETIVLKNDSGIVCFAQSKPVLQTPKNNPREARLFVTFRPNEKIIDEISITSGYEFNNQNSIIAKSGKKKYKFDITKESFACMADNKKGSQTNDHYSLIGFTKAYGAAKKNCS